MAEKTSTAPAPVTPLPRTIKTSITPNGKSQQQETIRLAIRLGSVVLLTASVLIYACLRSKDLSVAEILAIIGCGAALAGLATAAHRGGGGSTGTTIIGGAMLMIATVVASGCGAGSQVEPSTCVGAAVQAALDVLEHCRPVAGEACPIERQPPYEPAP